jgi:hypothetical protein
MRALEPCRSRMMQRSLHPWPDFVGIVPTTHGRRGLLSLKDEPTARLSS